MIKLIDLLNEEIKNPESGDLHWRDNFQNIIEAAQTALSSNDPETINTQVDLIINNVQAAADKHESTYAKQPTPTFVSSNIANSYSGDDSDINAFSGGTKI